MAFTQGVLSFFQVNSVNWYTDWVWGFPLIVVTAVIHVLGLGLMWRRAARISSRAIDRHHPIGMFIVFIGAAILLATSLHGTEAAIWAAAYRLLGALPDNRSAMLYSVSAMTSYGHANVFLENRWQLMGAMEALNGCLLFGLTTAFLFGMIQRVGLLESKRVILPLQNVSLS
jgi:hypothetical protein